MEILLQFGASVDLCDESGATPLHHAVDVVADTAHQMGLEPNPAMLTALLRAGANPDVRDTYGETPIDVAKGYSYDEGVRLLLQHSPSPRE